MKHTAQGLRLRKKLLAVIFMALILLSQAAPPARAEGLRAKELADVWIYTGALVYRATTKVELKTFTGVVVKVDDTHIRNVADPQVFLKVKGAEGLVYVLLGPSDYLKQQGFAVKVNDQVQVTGVRLVWKTKKPPVNLAIAHEVKTEGQVLKLRYDSGLPRWSGGANPPPGQ